ncbi:MAG TPA: sulfotransferase [Vicinamibacterales bacterium]|nr:sulfotransferase [Vicinamibacterales bacterium]
MQLSNLTPAKPNLFIVGFAKCGTTALHEYLSTHPNVHPSFPKEPHFFIEPVWRRSPARTEAEYLRFFAGASADARVLLDSSAVHIYSPQALRKIRAFNPDAKILVLVRNPVKMLASLHRYSCRMFIEEVPDFEDAWNLQASRARGQKLPRRCEFPALLQYENLGRVGTHVATLLDIWPRSQVKIVFFDEFVNAPLEQYREILDFIGLPYDGRTTFPKVNEGGVWKSRVLGRLMLKTWPLVIKVFTRVGVVGVFRRPRFWMFLWGLNSARDEHIPMEPAFRQRLIDVFREDIQLLSAITDRNLDHWLA